MTSFREYVQSTQSKKDPVSSITTMQQYPTGYMYLDYGTGSYLTVYDEDEIPLFQYHNIGITCGSVNTIVAKSQGGKTSLASAMAAAIIEPYITDLLFKTTMRDVVSYSKMKSFPEIAGAPIIQIMDTERTFSADYAKKIMRYTNPLVRKHVSITPVTTDMDVIKEMVKHIDFKITHTKKIPMPMLDIFGEPVYEYPPTVIIIDSASQLLMENCDDPSEINKAKTGILDIYKNATNNMSGARRAKMITALYSQLVNYAKKYNIIIFAINHINKMPAVMGVPTKQYRGLRPGETIGGGERAIYLTATILRLDVIKSIGTTKSTMLNLGDDVTGFVAIASWIKSKSNSKSNICQLLYTNDSGYDPLLSNLYYGKEIGHIPKSGNSLYIPGYEKLKFTLKNYKEVFGDHPELISAYVDELTRQCEPMLDNPNTAYKKDQKVLDQIRDDIHDEYGSSHGDMMDMDDMFASVINS